MIYSYTKVMNMKKKVLMGFIIILFLVIIFGITYMLFLEKRNNGISLIKDNVVIEYGNAYNPNIEELVDLSKYKSGVKVFHKKFGEGIINQVEPEGEDLKVDIDFNKVGHKRLMAKFANLEIIG